MPINLKDLARYGAPARVAELQREMKEILVAFPELKRNGSFAAATPGEAASGGARRRKPMTAAQRKAVGERMRKYWAARRKDKKP